MVRPWRPKRVSEGLRDVERESHRGLMGVEFHGLSWKSIGEVSGGFQGMAGGLQEIRGWHQSMSESCSVTPAISRAFKEVPIWGFSGF